MSTKLRTVNLAQLFVRQTESEDPFISSLALLEQPDVLVQPVEVGGLGDGNPALSNEPVQDDVGRGAAVSFGEPRQQRVRKRRFGVSFVLLVGFKKGGKNETGEKGKERTEGAEGHELHSVLLTDIEHGGRRVEVRVNLREREERDG